MAVNFLGNGSGFGYGESGIVKAPKQFQYGLLVGIFIPIEDEDVIKIAEDVR